MLIRARKNGQSLNLDMITQEIWPILPLEWRPKTISVLLSRTHLFIGVVASAVPFQLMYVIYCSLLSCYCEFGYNC